MLTLRYMPNTSSVLNFHPTLVPLLFVQSLYSLFFIYLSPPLFYLLPACCSRVRKRANCLAPHQCIIFGISIFLVPALLNTSLHNLTRYVGSTGYKSVACPPVSLRDAAHTVTLEIGLANISQSSKSKTMMRAMKMRR